MYLTRMALNPARRAGRTLLASPHAMHAAVLAGFPPDAAEDASGRVLWRVDRGERQRVELYVASPARPDLTHLVEQAGWPTTHTWATRDYRPLLERLAAGQRWAFRLTANPVRSIRRVEGERTKPVAHVTAEQQRRWLVERVGRLGFTLGTGADGEPDVVVHDRGVVRFKRGTGTVTLGRATYDGVLQVTDPDVLRRVLTHGIGRAKGYGCGLMTLAPLP